MSEDAIQPEVGAFIAEHIDSVVQVEILTLLHAQPARPFTAADVARELRIESEWARTQLADLCARGIITCDDTAARLYRHGAHTPRLEAAVVGLVRAYAGRRVTVIGMIFSKPVDKLRTFADAFRLRKDRDKDKGDG